MRFVRLYLYLIEIPLRLALSWLGYRPTQMWFYAYDAVATFIILCVVLGFFKRTKQAIKTFIWGGESLLESAEIDALVTKKKDHIQEPVHTQAHVEETAKLLKRARQYDQLAETYSAANRPKEAAKWFRKAGDLKLAAIEMAKAGKPLKAAKLLMKQGDFAGAANFFAQGEKFDRAAMAYTKAGEPAKAADAYRRIGQYGQAAQAYQEYFENARDPAETQLQVAEACLNMLRSEPGASSIALEERKPLLAGVAARFEQAKRYEQAAKLFEEAGDMGHAGETYLLADKLEEAAKCLRAAGMIQKAWHLLGRSYDKKGMWQQAAQAYVSAGDFLRAADSYAKIPDVVNAGKCYERAGDFYKAGLAYAHAMRFAEAIPVIQKLPKDHKYFDQSRALLGRCYYELHDFDRCAATLENHLLGKRVERDNLEYFDMLARAFEQLGKLDDSRRILYKIHTVDSKYGDVSQRVSNIESRISLQAVMSTPAPSPAGQARAGDEGATQIMQGVESALGSRYRIEKELGRGGMGVVYMARDTQLDRPVALKFLGGLVDGSEEYRLRFVREAKAAAKISHPNVVSIYDISATAGKAYIAMEYVEGQNLHRYVLNKGRLSPREAVNIIGQACAALAAIHDAGVVHRDIKPDNVLIGKGGLVKLSDFGLAKSEDMRMTKSGVIMGTPVYMSPEQATGKDADKRSDIYSIGLVLHEALTGKACFSDGDILHRQVEETPPRPSELVEGIPKKLDDIVMKCIAKNPDDRFQNARELLQALRQVGK